MGRLTHRLRLQQAQLEEKWEKWIIFRTKTSDVEYRQEQITQTKTQRENKNCQKCNSQAKLSVWFLFVLFFVLFQTVDCQCEFCNKNVSEKKKTPRIQWLPYCIPSRSKADNKCQGHDLLQMEGRCFLNVMRCSMVQMDLQKAEILKPVVAIWSLLVHGCKIVFPLLSIYTPGL